MPGQRISTRKKVGITGITHTQSINQEDWRHKTYCFNPDLAWFVDV